MAQGGFLGILGEWHRKTRHFRLKQHYEKMALAKTMEELKWQQFFDDQSMDFRTNKRNPNYADFNKHPTTRESGSWFCPKWLPARLKCLEDSGRRQYRKSEGLRVHPGNTVHKKLRELSSTKLNTKDGHREILRFYDKIREEGMRPSISITLAALKACSSLTDLKTGKKIHSDVIDSGDDSNIYVENTLVDMYAKCASMVDARRVFDRMPHHDVVSWNAIILGYARSGEGELALQLFSRIQPEGCMPDARTFVAALKACASVAEKEEGTQVEGKLVKIGSLENGIAIHNQAVKSGHELDIFVSSTLVDMYAKCGSVVDARSVFDRMPHHGVVSWNAIILGYARSGDGELALQLFASMQSKGCVPGARTFVAILTACTSLAEKEEGKQFEGKLVKIGCLEKGIAIHSQAAKTGHELNIFVASTLVDMYAKCGSMVDARWVFDRMPYHGVVSWTAIILGYAGSGEGELALNLFARMQLEGCAPDTRTFVAALKACACLAEKEEAKQIETKVVKMECLEKGITIHSQAAKSGHELDIFVASTLVDMYAKCGSMVDALGVFERMPHHGVSWTAIILGYARYGEGELALQFFGRMQAEGCAADARTFVAALKACTSLAEKEKGKQVEGKLVKTEGLEKGIFIHSQAAKSGHELDIFVASTLVDMYAKCGSMADARGFFDRMPHRTVVSWNAIILGYAQSGESEVALRLFGRMRPEGCAPDAVTFVAALKACGNLVALEAGKEIHAEICNLGLQSDSVVASCLVDFYGKCGSMGDAEQVFISIPRRDIVVWSAMMAGYSRQGDTKRVFHLFQRMQEEVLQANDITFLSILTVCSHAGLVDKGKEYFQIMCSDYGITPSIDHYNCIVDLLGRANQLADAVAVVKNMPVRPDLVIWMTVLGACRKWMNVAVGRLAFESVLRFDDKHGPAYVWMANIYAGAGMWEESEKVRRNARAWKKPEKSCWTDNSGAVHTFVVGDTSHPQSDDILAKLKGVFVKMEEEGYVPDLYSNASDDETESALCGHSEKLAIACALINTAPGTPIRIVKNLRVCDDCHKAIAIISKIEQRAIICKDASRLHFFKDGKCSCGDFW